MDLATAFSNINWLSVVVAAASSFLVGGLWYGPLFGKAWMNAFEAADLDPEFYTHRQRPLDEVFPWEHLSTTIRKKFLSQDYLWSLDGRVRIDCREQCFACGILPTFANLRRDNPGDVWQCPEVKNKRVQVISEEQITANV